MNQLRTAPAVGIAGCLLYLLVLAVPYAIVETTSAVGAYYDSGALTPAVPALFALVAVIVLAAGREGRTDPSVAAGAGLVLGLFILGLTVLWAATVPVSLVLGLTESPLIEHHRWLAAAAAVPIPLGAALFACALGLF
jgi:hypothetical protein